jgi:hypothetical protein
MQYNQNKEKKWKTNIRQNILWPTDQNTNRRKFLLPLYFHLYQYADTLPFGSTFMLEVISTLCQCWALDKIFKKHRKWINLLKNWSNRTFRFLWILHYTWLNENMANPCTVGLETLKIGIYIIVHISLMRFPHFISGEIMVDCMLIFMLCYVDLYFFC